MRTLPLRVPTPEQLTVVDDASPGFWLIRGAAGSGKTTTALLRLGFLLRYRSERASFKGDERVRVLVLTFNRTLRGYIDELVHAKHENVDLEIRTFGQWAQKLLDRDVLKPTDRAHRLSQLAHGRFPWSNDFLVSEADYVLGHFLPPDLPSYRSLERKGRGRAPRVSATHRERLLDEVLAPYETWKAEQGVVDWNDLAVELATRRVVAPYDVVIADEAQDFSANQIRAVVRHLADDFSCTFIRDATQRVYPNFFTWREVDVVIPRGQSRELRANHRNTKQIVAFARPLVDGIEQTEDSSLPDLRGCEREGPKPLVLRGRLDDQLDWAIRRLRSGEIAADETIAFLHPSSRSLEPVERRLNEERLPWSSLTKAQIWPASPEQIALSTMHSAKGLEFDHVIVLRYDATVVPHGGEDGDARLETHRRLLAMAIGRARKSVAIGYSPSDASPLIALLDPATFDVVDL